MLDFQKATEAVKHHENILILPSSPVDGDSIGSALAVYSLLQSMGKNATVVLTSEIPDIYRFLPNIDAVQKTAQLYSDFMITIDLKNGQLDNIKHEIVDNKVNIIVTPEHGTFTPEQVSFPEPKKYFDLLVTVDCADLTQLGSFYKQNYAVFSDIPSINIDHHVSNKNFGSLNLVDTSVSSTTQLLFSWFKAMNAEIDEDIATLLLAGIITDTGSFQNANTTPECFDAAAELIDLGGRQQEIIRHVYKTKQLSSLKLWGKILSKIQVNETYRYLWSSATQSDFEQTGTVSSDKGDIIDELMSNAQEADVILLLEEKPDGSLHGSLRSTSEEIDVSPIAAKYNGGGHAMASGFTIPNATVDTHQTLILQTIEEFQRQRLQPQSPQPQSNSPLEPAASQPKVALNSDTPQATVATEVEVENTPSKPDTFEIQPPSAQEVNQVNQPEAQNEPKLAEENDLDNLPSLDDIVGSEDAESAADDVFSPDQLKDPSDESFDPIDLQDELNAFNQTFTDSPANPAESLNPEIDKLTRDFVSKENNEDTKQTEDSDNSNFN